MLGLTSSSIVDRRRHRAVHGLVGLEALPSAATAMVPLVVFPFAGVLKEREVAAAYGDPVIMLFMGAFMASKAVEHWGAHRRIAHAMMATHRRHERPRILLALMLTTTFCSFWINNTSIALMMLPVALATLEHDKSGKLAVPLLLGVAYCASIGGIATPIGTAPNGVFQVNLQRGHRPHNSVSPVDDRRQHVAMLMMLAAWGVLSWAIRGVPAVHVQTGGRWTTAQIRTLIVFGLAALGVDHARSSLRRLVQLDAAQVRRDIEGDMIGGGAGRARDVLHSQRREGRQPTAGLENGRDDSLGRADSVRRRHRDRRRVQVVRPVGSHRPDRHRHSRLAARSRSSACSASSTTFLSEVTSNTATANILMPILGAAAQSPTAWTPRC